MGTFVSNGPVVDIKYSFDRNKNSEKSIRDSVQLEVHRCLQHSSFQLKGMRTKYDINF